MGDKRKLLLLGDRYASRDRMFNLGDQAMQDGAYRLLQDELGFEILPGPWKPFPYFGGSAFRKAAGGGAETVFERWFSSTMHRSHDSSAEDAVSRWMDRTVLFNNRLTGMIEDHFERKSGMGPLSALKPRLLRKHFAARMVRLIGEADVVCFLGGGLMADHLWTYAPSFLFELYLAKRLGRKVVVVSESVAATDPLMLEAVGHVYRMLDFHLVREPFSRERLLALGVKQERIAVCPDLAFAVTKPDTAGLDPLPTGSVALNIRGDREVDVESWRRLVNLLSASGRQVFAVSTCPALDMKIMRSVAAGSPLRMAPTSRDLRDIVMMLKGCDLVVTDRFHGAIFALLAGTAVLPMESNTFKMRGLFHLFEYPLGLLPRLNATSYASTVLAVERLMSNLPAARAAISTAVPMLKGQVSQGMRIALAG